MEGVLSCSSPARQRSPPTTQPHDAACGHHERAPYTPDTLRSAYHARDVDAWLMQHMAGAPFDLFLSHDWPRGVEHCGDLPALLRRKPHFADDVAARRLGSPALAQLLQHLRPAYWVAAHLHVQYAALVPHAPPAPPTRFLALDKPLPGRGWMQLLTLPRTGSLELALDGQWAAVLAARLSAVDYYSAHPVPLPPVVTVAPRAPVPLPPTLLGTDQTAHVLAAVGAGAEDDHGGGVKRSRADPNAIDVDDEL